MQHNTNDKKYFNKLILKIADKGKYALEEFHIAYGRMIKVVAKLIVHSKDLVDEVINDVLVKVWLFSAKRQYLDKPLGWLYTVISNCAKDKLKEREIYSELHENIAVSKSVESIEDNDEFIRRIEFLNEEEQKILILKFANGLTFKEIANELDSNTSTVSSSYYRALEKIKNNL